jgi:hypothetical protein
MAAPDNIRTSPKTATLTDNLRLTILSPFLISIEPVKNHCSLKTSIFIKSAHNRQMTEAYEIDHNKPNKGDELFLSIQLKKTSRQNPKLKKKTFLTTNIIY